MTRKAPAPRTPPAQARCPVCDRIKPLDAGGRFLRHGDTLGGPLLDCPGSGLTVAQANAEARKLSTEGSESHEPTTTAGVPAAPGGPAKPGVTERASEGSTTMTEPLRLSLDGGATWDTIPHEEIRTPPPFVMPPGTEDLTPGEVRISTKGKRRETLYYVISLGKVETARNRRAVLRLLASDTLFVIKGIALIFKPETRYRLGP